MLQCSLKSFSNLTVLNRQIENPANFLRSSLCILCVLESSWQKLPWNCAWRSNLPFNILPSGQLSLITKIRFASLPRTQKCKLAQITQSWYPQSRRDFQRQPLRTLRVFIVLSVKTFDDASNYALIIKMQRWPFYDFYSQRYWAKGHKEFTNRAASGC